jgi:hypothetical protein
MGSRTAVLLLLLLLPVPLLAGCPQSNAAPHLFEIEPQTAYVGSSLELKITAADPDDDSLIFTFSSPTQAIRDRATLEALGGNAAHFVWQPEKEDEGQHLIDFTVTDGELVDVESVQVTVKPAGSDTAPVFRKPEGDGMTLDLASTKCVSLQVVVEDPDSASVEIRQSPSIQGSKLEAKGSYEALFSWCPTQAQTSKSTYTLGLEADDHDNPAVFKSYTILLRTDLPTNCPGNPPVINHTPPSAMTTSAQIQITAGITDEKGIKEYPVVYHTTQLPPDLVNLDYEKLKMVSMKPAGPNNYQAQLPNPTAQMTSGQSATIYYVIVAEDDDDRTGPCDHRTRAPPNHMYQVMITRP